MEKRNSHTPKSGNGQSGLYGWASRVGDWAGRIFGCWHRDLSLPITCGGETYRMCINCGARRRFKPDTWMTVGGYYHQSISSPQMAEEDRERSSRQSPAGAKERSPSQAQGFMPSQSFYEITQFP